MAAPAQFDGPGDAWSPEHLLLASVGSCLILTLRAVAARSKIPLGAIEVAVGGPLARQDGVTRFTEIVLRPTLTVACAEDRAGAIDLLEKAERNCLISASLSTPVTMEPTICDASARVPHHDAA